MRQFLAIPLPDDLRREAGAAASLLAREAEGWRLTREEGLHATIRFLGEVEPSRHEALLATWRTAATGTGLLRLRLCGARVLPSARRPRVLALAVLDDTPEGALALLAERIETAARSEGFAPEPRPFSGHVTVARVRRGVRPAVLPVDRVGELGAFLADRLVLFRSELDRDGSRYRELAWFPLAPESSL